MFYHDVLDDPVRVELALSGKQESRKNLPVDRLAPNRWQRIQRSTFLAS
jgi:hypothetical protein